MKKLITICLLLTIAFTSQAQNGKPTKEETLQYLKATLLDVWGGNYLVMYNGKKSGFIYALHDMMLDGCILKIKIKERDEKDDKKNLW